jgi:glutaredoxin
MLSQSLFFGSLTITSLVSSALIFSSNVHAQNTLQLDNTQILNYSKVILRMEPERQQAFDKIKKIIGDQEVPKIVCNDPNSYNSLPSQARDVAIDYCNRSQQIVEANGLSIDEFNRITVALQDNEDLKRKIYNNLIRLQKNPENQ